MVRAFGEQRSRIDDLERANRELRGFAFAAAHDLASPLNTLSAYLQLIRRRGDGALDDELLELIGLALEGTDRMRRLIGGMLDQARAGSFGDWGWFETAPLAAEILADLHADVQAAGAEVKVGALPAVYGDRQAIGRVLTNLVLNAI